MKNYKGISVDLDSCDKEPIHIIGRIQPHGYLIIVDESGLLIEQVSANIEQLTGFTVNDLLDKPLFQFTEGPLAEVASHIQAHGKDGCLIYKLSHPDFVCMTSRSEGKLVVEFEPVRSLDINSVLQEQDFSVAVGREIKSIPTLVELCQATAERIQQFLDYDRVMIYQFDEDWNGHVVAEKVKPGVHSYQHHHFPASDIPAQARRMLLEKTIRQIPDVEAEGVEIVPYFNPGLNNPLNMIPASLRNPSEIHLEYLKNMQVKASLSFSIIVKDKLWGIIACHHEQPLFIDVHQRLICDAIAQVFSSCIATTHEQEDLELEARYKENLNKLVQQMEKSTSLMEGLMQSQTNALDLTGASGAALCLGQNIYPIGHTPQESDIRLIADWLESNKEKAVYYTHELSKDLSTAASMYSTASGLMALEIDRHNKEYLLFFKPEILQYITWAGNPEKLLYASADDLHLHPRKSFEKWEQLVHGKSYKWTRTEIQVAQQLRKEIISARLKQYTETLRMQKNKLEDFANISSHNLRSPLNNIKMLLSLYKSNPSTERAEFVLDKLENISDQMQTTFDDLHAVLRLNQDQEVQKEKIALPELMEAELQALAPQIEASQASIITDFQVKQLYFVKVYLQSILHNLISNALKYKHPARRPEINVRSFQNQNGIYLIVSDNGMGINLTKHGKKLFGLYKTFHRHPEAKGMGLYLVKTQVEAMGGSIQVESQEEVGTTFILQLSQTGQADE